MDARPRLILFYEEGRVKEWLDSIEDLDVALYDMIVARLERVEDGNLGDCGRVGEGVSELRFLRTGPGYRIYFGQDGDLVILVHYGTKKTQAEDVKIARKFWRSYKRDGKDNRI